MSEFVGRTGGQRYHSYPNTRAGQNTASLFARNFAIGPAGDEAVLTTGTQVTWGSVDVPGSTTVDVPITPLSTGVVRVIAAIGIRNDSGAAKKVTIQVQVDNVTQATPSPEFTVPANAAEVDGHSEIPFLAQLLLPIGTEANIQILATVLEDSVSLVLRPSDTTIEVFEVPVSTG